MDANLALAQRFFGGFAKGDVAEVRACLAPEVVWRVPGVSLVSGEHRGPEAVLRYFASLRDLTGGSWKALPIDMLVGRSGVVLLARGSGEREGRRFDAGYALHLAMREGAIVEARLYPEDLRAFESFWS